jgi:NAD(P)H-dependent flavin oxidoreductase YrpB (nitropropane dioxygenase family)
MLQTAWTRLLDLRAPIQLAPLPFHGVPDLVLAVADSGGLAMAGLPTAGPKAVAETLDSMASRTRGVIGVNFLMPFLDRDCLQVAASRARVIEFFYGEPSGELVDVAHRGGALAAWQVGSVAEAVAAEAAGCDFVVAQGIEAGGHVRGQVGALTLLAQVLDRVRCPVVAAGGIGSARQLAAVLAAGAGGARMGTRFLAATEANVHPRYLELLLAARSEDTVLTEAFSVMWPNAPHRVLRCSIEAAAALEAELAGTMPTPEGPLEIPRGAVISPTRETTGTVDAMALYAGESVAAIDRVEPAAAIINDLVAGAAALLQSAPAGVIRSG